MIEVACHFCGSNVMRSASHVNRSRKNGQRLYCNRACAGKQKSIDTRRFHTPEEKRAHKSAYDRKRREALGDSLLEKRRIAYHAKPNREQERIWRKRRAPKHAEYCRQPAYRAWKKKYDRQHLAKKKFGQFAEAALILREIENEVADRISRYEIYMQNGTINKALQRRRAL